MLLNRLAMHAFDVLDHVLASRGPSGVRGNAHWNALDADLTNLGEFAALRWSWFRSRGEDLVRVLSSAAGHHALLASLSESGPMVREGVTSSGEAVAVPDEPAGWEPGSPFLLFEERLKTRLVASGMAAPLAYALAGALHELASNADEHSRSALSPIAIYDVRPERWSLSVSDVGVGMIGSLSQNPEFKTLQNDVSAMQAALRDGVSATGRPGRGHGFRAIFRPFADRACVIRLRSVGAAANWTGKAPAAHLLSLEAAPARQGLHVQLSGSFEVDD